MLIEHQRKQGLADKRSNGLMDRYDLNNPHQAKSW